MKKFLAILFIGWLLRHCFIIPIVDWDEHEVTGFEIRIKF